jgi:BirA family transcriptional regulator, biotin operon repressor / biotin---[acetyl-CoA-carboxylase] ligase
MSAVHAHPEDLTGWTTAIESALPGIEHCCVAQVLVYAKTTSTQDAAWRHRPQNADTGGIVVLASIQTDGRGQRGRRWDDGQAQTLPVSFALRTPLTDVGLAARAGLGALEACRLHAPNADIRIKWPNDIVVRDASGDRKLAGVLVERRDGVAVVGVGINVSQTADELAARGLTHAASLGTLGGKTNRLMLAIDLIAGMSRWLAAADDAVRVEWATHDAMLGTHRAFVVGGERVEGEVTALDPLGVIHVRTEGGGVAVPVERGVVAPVRDEARSSELSSTLKKLNDRFGDDLRQLAE